MMGTFSACSGFALVFLSGRAGYRRLLFCRVAGVLSVIVFALMTALIWGSARGSIYAYLFCVLSLTSSLSGIMLPLLRQTNTEETSDIAVSFMNFSLFLFVAIFGNLVGWLMNCFPPERHNDLLIYGRSSYLAVFVVLATFAIVALFCAIRLNNRPGDPVTVALSKADDPTLALAGSDAA
jgi:glucan phosphoethanolaminetransferase (alkaline phosphatase superfamily)